MAAPDPLKLSLNTATVRDRWTLAQAVEGCARHGIRGISPWRDKIAELGLAKAARRIRDADLPVTGLCRGGMFPAADAAGRLAAIEDNRRAIEEAATISAECLVLVTGGLAPGSKDIVGARKMVRDGIAAILPEARQAGVKLAIEPLHPMYAADRSCVNTLDQALDLCEALGDGIGVAVDVYHVWWDPRLMAAIQRAGKARIFAFHICDWLVPTTDLLLDRGMMGDGVIDIRQARGWVEAQGFSGYSEVEIFSTGNWWRRDGGEVLDTCIQRHRACV